MTRLPDFVIGPIEAVLLPDGFSRSRRAGEYRKQVDDGVAAIHFVSDKWGGPRSEARFTSNIGFFSHRLSRVFGPPALTAVGPDTLHWYRWIGYITPADAELEMSYWEVTLTRPSQMADVVTEVRDRGLRALSAHSSDAGLRDEWLSRSDPWLHPAVMTSYVAVLVADLGPPDRLPEMRERVQALAKGGSSDARAALRYLNSSADSG